MEEKIIEAKFKKNTFFKNLFIGSLGLILLVFLYTLITYLTGEADYGLAGIRPYTEMYDSYFDYVLKNLQIFTLFLIGVLGILISRFFIWFMEQFALTVTTRKVTGKTSFGKMVDLPLTQISAVALGSFSRISVATSSGSIHFWNIENRSEIYEALSELIGNIQEKGNDAPSQPTVPTSHADELKKYKDLLDSGVITQEEFDAKKKQLLGL